MIDYIILCSDITYSFAFVVVSSDESDESDEIATAVNVKHSNFEIYNLHQQVKHDLSSYSDFVLTKFCCSSFDCIIAVLCDAQLAR